MQQALLVQPQQQAPLRYPIFWTICNLVNNIVGAGFLALPWCLKELKEGTATDHPAVVFLILLVLVGLLHGVSFWLHGRACEHVRNVGPQQGDTTYLAAQSLLPHRMMDWVEECGIYVAMAAALILLAIYRYKKPLFRAELGLRGVFFWILVALVFVLWFALPDPHNPAESNGNPADFRSSWRWGLLAVIFLYLPLSCQLHLMPLGILSMLAVLVGILSVLLALEPNHDPNRQLRESATNLVTRPAAHLPVPAATEQSTFQAYLKVWSILLVSFTAHYNAPKYYGELGPGNQLQNFRRAVCVSYIVVSFAYLWCGTMGYQMYGSDTQQDLLNNLSGSWKAPLTHGFYLLILWADFPKVIIGMRQLSGSLCRRCLNRQLTDQFELLLLIIASLGWFLPLTDILAVKGALFGSLMVYVIPASILLRGNISPQPSKWEVGLSWIMTFAGLLLFLTQVKEITFELAQWVTSGSHKKTKALFQ
ncbi:hypothetical protein AK812_SmicGene1811 [Symbiodinium microadriaticum]|uniref:Amino acid transporter transmembrane domain-containing protein n=1 Tax=Symbiodinium microadriaticum TaxID=2951 RepID=A0A1Q9F356_SYMMI|nr:hypothetical protein AK812_SmicGene1811 [Symbiodinium microadriaticum]CAE6947030.1 unnamed protein product [Symbiodinium sp. KB8]